MSQTPMEPMACQLLPGPVESIAHCSIGLPQEVGGSTLPQLFALYSLQHDPGLGSALMGTASFLPFISLWASPSAFFPSTLGIKAGLGWDLRPILEESRTQQMK